MLRKPKPGEKTGPIEAPFNDTDFKSTYPTLADHLTSTVYDDRSPRRTSTLLIFCENGVLRICLNDRDNNRSSFFTAETVEAALMSIENALAMNAVEWRSRSGGSYGGAQTPF